MNVIEQFNKNIQIESWLRFSSKMIEIIGDEDVDFNTRRACAHTCNQVAVPVINSLASLEGNGQEESEEWQFSALFLMAELQRKLSEVLSKAPALEAELGGYMVDTLNKTKFARQYFEKCLKFEGGDFETKLEALVAYGRFCVPLKEHLDCTNVLEHLTFIEDESMDEKKEVKALYEKLKEIRHEFSG